MTKVQKARHRIIEQLNNIYGLEQDRWGNIKFIATNGATYRLKFQRQSIRFERKQSTGWLKILTRTYLQYDHTDILMYLHGCRQA